MSRSGEIALDFGGAERTFRLGIGQIRKLQESCDAGPLGIAARCQLSTFVLHCQATGEYLALSRLDLRNVAEKPEVREVILQGLLGANMPAAEALKLVRDWVEERPLDENLVIAARICGASSVAVDDEVPVGEPLAAAEVSPNSPAASSDLERMASTPSGALSDGPQPRSTP